MSVFVQVWWNNMHRLDQAQKRCVWSGKLAANQLNKGLLSQSASSNHAFLITKGGPLDCVWTNQYSVSFPICNKGCYHPLLLAIFFVHNVHFARKDQIEANVGTRCTNFACSLFSWMFDDSYLFFRSSIFRLIVYLYISLLLLSYERRFLPMRTGKSNIYSFSRPILPQGKTSVNAKVYSIYLDVHGYPTFLRFFFSKSWSLAYFMVSFNKICVREHFARSRFHTGLCASTKQLIYIGSYDEGTLNTLNPENTEKLVLKEDTRAG